MLRELKMMTIMHTHEYYSLLFTSHVPMPQVTKLEDVKASGNWMYAAKMDSEGADMYDAAVALRDAMIELGIAIDGGKDSLSMAAKVRGVYMFCSSDG